jgi:hypothetical protein
MKRRGFMCDRTSMRRPFTPGVPIYERCLSVLIEHGLDAAVGMLVAVSDSGRELAAYWALT